MLGNWCVGIILLILMRHALILGRLYWEGSFMLLDLVRLRDISWLVSITIIGFVLASGTPPTHRWLLVILTITTLIFMGTSSLLVLYIVFEARLIPILIIIILDGPQPERISAINYLLAYRVLPRMRILWLLLRSQLDRYRLLLVKWEGNWLIIIMGLTILVKSPIYGAHSWLALAHVEAPTIGSVVLAGLLLKLGTIGYYRVVEVRRGLPLILASLFLILGRTACTVVCWIQSDVKAFVAYRSITHMNFALWTFSSFYSLVGEFRWIISWVHGLIASCIFISAGLIIHKINTRATLLCQLSKFFPMQMIWGLILLLNCSVPPTQSFASEVGSVASLICSWNLRVLAIFVYGIGCLHFSLYLGIAHSQVKGIAFSTGFVEMTNFFSVIVLRGFGILVRLLV